jgi:Ca2+-binding RTX toxin-like protein
LNIIARKDYEDLQKNILNEKEQVILMWRLFPFSFISNAGNDTLKDLSGGNDIYKFKKGDGADTIYDIKGNDTIIFDNTVKKEDITFTQSEDLKSLIINYSATDSITITNYFDSFSKIENIEKRVA